MKVTFIDESGDTVTITDPITIEGDVQSLTDLAAALAAGVEKARLERPALDVLVRVTEAGSVGSVDQPRVENNPAIPTESDTLPAPQIPWESTEPPRVALNDWQLDLLRRTRAMAIPIKDIEAAARAWVLENCDLLKEHRLFSLTHAHVAIAPAGLYALDRSEREALLPVEPPASDAGPQFERINYQVGYAIDRVTGEVRDRLSTEGIV